MTDYTPEQREGKHGEKMIEVKVRFWTDNLASDAGKVIPKHAWTSGVVRIASNKSHGIVPKNPKRLTRCSTSVP